MRRLYYDFLDIVHYIDFFTEEEHNEMYNELMMICVDEIMIDAKEAGGALDSSGTMLRNNKGLPIESMMDDSSIVRIFNNKIPFPCNEYKNVSHLVNYYTEGHYYGFHRDKSEFTAITIFQPKKYTGGDLTFRHEYGIIIPELRPKDLIIFPGNLEHSVSPVVGGNRISVSRFMK
jgi:hypothetical protein